MTKELEHDDLSETVESGKMHNITSKAGRLAMELSAEKNVLHKNLKSYKVNTTTLSLLHQLELEIGT